LSTKQFCLIFKGHKSLEYWCLVIHLTSVSTISYAESNGVAFFSKYKAAQPKGPFTRAIFAAILGRFSSSDGCEGVDEL
jgi:hypothetical protein